MPTAAPFRPTHRPSMIQGAQTMTNIMTMIGTAVVHGVCTAPTSPRTTKRTKPPSPSYWACTR
jgi:hypothetical protein